MKLKDPKHQYLDLLKKALSFSLWPEPPMLLGQYARKGRSPLKRGLLSAISKVLGKRVQIAVVREISQKRRDEGHVHPGYADTMIGLRRLDNLQYCVETALQDGVEGDLIETGVWRGGACIFMRGILAAYGVEDRRVLVADSFEGLPKPDAKRFPADKSDTHHMNPFLAVSQEQVEENFRRYGLLDDQVVFLNGWFEDTLAHAPTEKIAVLRLDGDMYGSTMVALEALYPKLSVGGFCIIDDYVLPGCATAVTDYRKKHAITSNIKVIDAAGRFWRKT